MTDDFPPRGAGKGRPARSPSSAWLHPSDHGPEWTYKPGAVMVGHWQGQPRGWLDDRHMVTVAGSRAGKSRAVLVPNLLRYPGPAVVVDPKGELAAATADARRQFGPVYVLDPFGEAARAYTRQHGQEPPAVLASARFNPFDELRASSPETLGADAALLADALIVPPKASDPHWTESAKNLITGLILHFLTADPARASLPGLRSALSDSNRGLAATFAAMAQNPAVEGRIANVGRAMAGKVFDDGEFTGELRSIVSTAAEQTRVLDDMADVSAASDFMLSGLGGGTVGTVYLVLPGLRLGTHFRWLRLVLYQALTALERAPVPYGRVPVWFVLEEFAALERMAIIETAAGYLAGFGVKLWVVLQDFSQLHAHYPESWETFLGNAGMLQAFANVDLRTTEYLSKRLGETVVTEHQDVRVSGAAMASGDLGRREHQRHPPLLAPFEVSRYFSKRSNRVLLLPADLPPTYLDKTPT